MPDPSLDIEMTVGFDFKSLNERLGEMALQIMEQGANRALRNIRQIWTGWAYDYPYARDEGQNGPVKPKGTSRKAWRVETLQATEGTRTVVIVNRARDVWKPDVGYSAYVHRKGSKILEKDNVKAFLEQDVIPQMAKALALAVERDIKSGMKKRVRVNRKSEKKSLGGVF